MQVLKQMEKTAKGLHVLSSCQVPGDIPQGLCICGLISLMDTK